MTELLLSIGLFTAGLTILTFAANSLIKGASGLAARLGVRPLVIGLTIVAFGTSAPELVTSVMAALSNSPDIAIGNVVGSNIANVGLIVGLIAMMSPVPVHRSFLKLDVPFLFGSMAALYLVSLDGLISRLDAVILFAGLLTFLGMTYWSATRRGDAGEGEAASGLTLRREIIYTVLGLVGLTVGAKVMVDAAVTLARHLGLSELVIGATIVAIGTSLPELAASVASVLKKQPDIGLGNVIGSNIFNICLILGLAPLVRPIPVSSGLLYVEYPLMVIFSLALALMMWGRRSRISRAEGGLLFAGFVAFLVMSFLKQ